MFGDGLGRRRFGGLVFEAIYLNFLLLRFLKMYMIR